MLQVDTAEEAAVHEWVDAQYNVTQTFTDHLGLFDFVKKEFVAKVHPEGGVALAKLQLQDEETEDFWDGFVNG